MKVIDKSAESGAGIEAKDGQDNTPLLTAAENEQFDILKKLIFIGAHINAQNKMGNTTIHRVLSRNQINTFKMLIEHGADINIVNKQLYTPYNIAKNKNLIDISEALNHIQIVDKIMSKNDLTIENISKILPDSIDSNLLKEVISKFNDNTKQLLRARIANKLWLTKSETVKDVQNEILSNSSANIDLIKTNLSNLNKNIDLIEKNCEVDFSFLKNISIYPSHGEHGSFIHNRGMLKIV